MGLLVEQTNVNAPTYDASSTASISSPDDGRLSTNFDEKNRVWHPQTNTPGQYLEVW